MYELNSCKALNSDVKLSSIKNIVNSLRDKNMFQQQNCNCDSMSYFYLDRFAEFNQKDVSLLIYPTSCGRVYNVVIFCLFGFFQ